MSGSHLDHATVSVLSLIEDHLGSGTSITVSSLGGVRAIESEADIVARAPYLDVFACLASEAELQDTEVLDALLLRGFAETDNASSFRDAANTVISSSSLRERISARLTKALELRVENRSEPMQNLLAAYALEALFRLALTGVISKFSPLRIMASLDSDPDPDGIFAAHAAKLTGAAFHVWRDDELLATLDRLRNTTEAEGEASFELGLAHLSLALDAESIDKVLLELETAYTLLKRAQHTDDDRADATAYCFAIDLVRGFWREASELELRPSLQGLTKAVSDRARQLNRYQLPDWLETRSDRDIQWARLVIATQRAASDLQKPSWLKAWSVMEQLLIVYDADSSFQTQGGLGRLLQPRIEASFVRERGLLGHLDELLSENSWMQVHADTSNLLRARITQLKDGSVPAGKSSSASPYPQLLRALNYDRLPPEISVAAAEALEQALCTRIGRERRIANPIVQKLLRGMATALTQCLDYENEVRADFDEMMLQIILFCQSRQDAGVKELGDRGNYLRDPDATEFDLQNDLWQWLAGNFPSCDLKTEVEGVATGRADIYAGFGTHRLIIEMKRHHGHLDKDAARKYCNQAGAYQNTNVKLGFLGVLEIVERSDPPASLEECVWYESFVPHGSQVTRHLVIFRVPGNLRSPSSLSPKTNKPKKKV
ncbi:hypothetical protein HNR03_000391 [Pseudomonas sp. JAI111]|uniref:hypothetical protein n=1 Tax=Pseudomonas sp. JAI111 TaxID=2735913 RepID=UPI0021685B91|nr:hypothetical protein [Pseudomonas sp. JAI111]MCS3835811.1 hypothetical protein [Pseudomonas sp. JAI111]